MHPCEIIAFHATEAEKSNGSGTGVARECISGFHVLPVNCHAMILAVNILSLGLQGQVTSYLLTVGQGSQKESNVNSH